MERLCACGCGQFTPPSKSHNPKYGYIRGEPLRFIPGHQGYTTKWTPEQHAKFREKQLGHPVSAETRQKMAAIHKALGTKPPQWAVEKSRQIHLGRTRERSKSWKGGRSVVNGYQCSYLPDHTRAHPNGYVYEHILVAEQKIGRSLTKSEVVHHINGDKTDNRPENLRVFASQADHARFHMHQRFPPSKHQE